MPRRVYPSLRAFFRDSGESQQQIADELGISYPSMSMFKSGQRQPALHLALRISQRCNVPLESLIRPSAKAKAS